MMKRIKRKHYAGEESKPDPLTLEKLKEFIQRLDNEEGVDYGDIAVALREVADAHERSKKNKKSAQPDTTEEYCRKEDDENNKAGQAASYLRKLIAPLKGGRTRDMMFSIIASLVAAGVVWLMEIIVGVL